jgi:hypothetical protein
MATIVAFPSVGPAQTTTTQPVRTPRNNVQGGSLAANRPGVTVSKAVGATATRNKEILSGSTITYEAETQTKKQVFLTTFFESMFKTLNDLVQQLTLALQATTTTGT